MNKQKQRPGEVCLKIDLSNIQSIPTDRTQKYRSKAKIDLDWWKSQYIFSKIDNTLVVVKR